MFQSVATYSVALAAVLVSAACSSSKSSNPLSPTVAGPIPGVAISSPQTVDPASGARIPVDKQPLTLVVGNASTSGVRPLSYVVEIATDADFANKVFSRDGITPGGDGRTSVKLADALAPGQTYAGKTYYWHVRAQDGANTGPFSGPSSFNLFTPIVIAEPVLVSPVNNIQINGVQPRFTMGNSARSGPVEAVTYEIELATEVNFVNKIAIWRVTEQPNQTSLDAPGGLPFGSQFFWHARAADRNVTGPWSAPQAFKTPAAPAPPPSPPPSPGPGPSDQIDINQVTFVNNPSDLGSWPRTAGITLVQFRSDALIVDFDRRTGANRWPNQPFGPGDSGQIQYTLGLCFFLSSHWYCSAAIQFWQDRPLEAGAPPANIPRDWYYDGRWSPMNGYLPAQGENVGVFVVAGNVRNQSNPSFLFRRERSNIVKVPFDRGNGSSYTFSIHR